MVCKDGCFMHYCETCPANKAVTSVLKQAREREQWRQEQSKKPVEQRVAEARRYLNGK